MMEREWGDENEIKENINSQESKESERERAKRKQRKKIIFAEVEFLKFTMEKCDHRTDISPVAVFYSVCTPECQRKTKAMSVLHRRWKEGRKISESDMRTVKIYQHVKNKN